MDQPEQKPPVPVKAEKREQAGMDIYVATCPNCRQERAASGLGEVACLCKTRLEFRETD